MKIIEKQIVAAMVILLLIMTGCGEELQMVSDSVKTELETASIEEESSEIKQETSEIENERITTVYDNIYKEMQEEKTLGSLSAMRTIVTRLGALGYTAVDCKNQVDMVGTKQVMQFCERVEAKEKAVLTMIAVSELGGFTKYDLQTEDGSIVSIQEYYQYEKGQLKKNCTERYQVEGWQYTEEGYLMFSGSCFSAERYVLTLSNAEEHVAFRVQPLDKKCRELNRRFLLPLGYARNNMFLIDWSEEDFGELNFYDLYEIFHPQINMQYAQDTTDGSGDGAIYRIPKEEFEQIIMTYFKIDSETLQTKTSYDTEDATYEFKPRGLYEAEYPEYPYSEVVSYSENSDGTITLVANVVFPYEGNSKVYAHEVVVRPLEDGGVQYVSNRIIPSENNDSESWHVDRLTEEEWEEYYGNSNRW